MMLFLVNSVTLKFVHEYIFKDLITYLLIYSKLLKFCQLPDSVGDARE